jgi:hypothetical protein
MRCLTKICMHEEIGEEDARGEEVGVREVGHPGTEGVRRPEMFDEDLHVRRIRGWSRGEVRGWCERSGSGLGWVVYRSRRTPIPW